MHFNKNIEAFEISTQIILNAFDLVATLNRSIPIEKCSSVINLRCLEYILNEAIDHVP